MPRASTNGSANPTRRLLTTMAELGGSDATGTIRIGRAWRDDPDMPVTSSVVGGGWPGTTLPDKAPNVLFVGDGFIDADDTIHDWQDYAGKLLAQRKANADRQAAFREAE